MIQRLHIIIRGAVQGVGFRPFIYRLATEMNLNGWVINSNQGVIIEVEGEQPILNTFLYRIDKEKPPRSFIQSLESSFLDSIGFTLFEIRPSKNNGNLTAIVLPDIATCLECLTEIFNPANRRYLYPFTNCTNCGPRFSIIESLPYDRPNTTMKNFIMCRDCLKEYENPLDRRFHAQPNACHKCGPNIELWDSIGSVMANREEALTQTLNAIRSGQIVALKGIGGFMLIVDARNDDAVIRLRERKHREEKPFAVMYPSADAVRKDCDISELEERLLCSPESPIVLLNRKIQNSKFRISNAIAPNNPYLGVMLPYSPLHHILMRGLDFPVVATSGNLSDEPICIDEHEALKRLSCIADVFLVHNRPIRRHVDDSIVREMMNREMVIRRARGYAPLPIQLRQNISEPILAVGAHLKNTIALSSGDNVFISQHIGDLETNESFEAFQNVIENFKSLYNSDSIQIVSDLHPAYLSTQYAKRSEKSIVQIQHHFAHVASCMTENQIDGEVLGISWDGTGFGEDGTIWGGEFLKTNHRSFERVASFRQFKLPGGNSAIKEPRRTAIGILYEIFGDKLTNYSYLPLFKDFSKTEIQNILKMLDQNINSPLTSSVGRLFDGVASIIGLKQRTSFEGQAAMEVEFAIGKFITDDHYRWSIIKSQTSKYDSHNSTNPKFSLPFMVDWEPMIIDMLEDVKCKTNVGMISIKFHNTIVEIIANITKLIGVERVVLSGGCFQNKYLTERAVQRLRAIGFIPYWHQRVPANDGGISLGQIAAAIKLQIEE